MTPDDTISISTHDAPHATFLVKQVEQTHAPRNATVCHILTKSQETWGAGARPSASASSTSLEAMNRVPGGGHIERDCENTSLEPQPPLPRGADPILPRFAHHQKLISETHMSPHTCKSHAHCTMGSWISLPHALGTPGLSQVNVHAHSWVTRVCAQIKSKPKSSPYFSACSPQLLYHVLVTSPRTAFARPAPLAPCPPPHPSWPPWAPPWLLPLPPSPSPRTFRVRPPWLPPS